MFEKVYLVRKIIWNQIQLWSPTMTNMTRKLTLSLWNKGSTSPREDIIPEENNMKTASSYILPPKQYIRSISVRKECQRGRKQESSYGPKLRFKNKIEHKSRSKSKTQHKLPPSGRIRNFNWKPKISITKQNTFSAYNYQNPRINSNYYSSIKSQLEKLQKFHSSSIIKDNKKINYNSLAECTNRMKNIFNNEAKFWNKNIMKENNSETGAYMNFSEESNNFSAKTVSGINFSHVPKPCKRMNSMKPLTKKIAQTGPRYKIMNRNKLNQTLKTDEGFIESINGNDSFLKYLEQTEI